MKLTDYVVDFLTKRGVKHVFGVTGGAVVHLFDSASKHPNMTPIFTHHEQAAALAAQAYARVNDSGIGVAVVTTGPGGTNTITGVCAAWIDSIPCLFIAGQTRREHASHGKGLRQLGSQEFDIISLVSHVTKYAAMVEDANMIKYHLQKAVYLATNGRPGPVWIDIPLNFQWASINPAELPDFSPNEFGVRKFLDDKTSKKISKSFELIKNAKRPLILAGYGIRLANADHEFREIITRLHIPFVTTWNTRDLMPSENNFHLGCLGFEGERGANLAVQNSDLLICIGSHLSIPITGTMFKSFAREAKIVMVNVDPIELGHRNVKVDVPILCSAKIYLNKLLQNSNIERTKHIDDWRQKCMQYKLKYNKIPTECWKQEKFVNPYMFIEILSQSLRNEDVIVVDGGGTVNQITFQTLKIKQGQRLMISGGICAMGTGLPESIGAFWGSGCKRTICLIGDGSLQFNIQELQTIIHHNIPVKIFVFNNGGYLAIRHTQNGFLDGNYVGSAEEGGLSLPNYQKVASAYGLKTIRINNHKELKRKIRHVLEESGPTLCEIMIARDQEIIPRLGFDKNPDGTGAPRPLEDMYPYLGREEFYENMIVKPIS